MQRISLRIARTTGSTAQHFVTCGGEARRQDRRCGFPRSAASTDHTNRSQNVSNKMLAELAVLQPKAEASPKPLSSGEYVEAVASADGDHVAPRVVCVV